jgi:hypothetical protein
LPITGEYGMMTQMKPRIPEQPEITLISPEGKVVRRSEYFECPEVISPENTAQINGVVEALETIFKNGDATGAVSQPRAEI